MGNIVRVLGSQFGELCQRIVEALLTSQCGRIVAARYVKVRREFEAALEQQNRLVDDAELDADFGKQANGIDVQRPLAQVFPADTLGNAEPSFAEKFERPFERGVDLCRPARAPCLCCPR